MRKANHCISVRTLGLMQFSILAYEVCSDHSKGILWALNNTDLLTSSCWFLNNLCICLSQPQFALWPWGNPPWFTVFKGPITFLWAWAAHYKLNLTRTTVCLTVSINIISDLVWSKTCQYSNFFKSSCWQWNILKNKHNLLSQLFLFPWKYTLTGLFLSFSIFYLPVFHIFSDYSGSCIDCTRIQRLLQVCQMCTKPNRQLLGTSLGKKQYDAH